MRARKIAQGNFGVWMNRPAEAVSWAARSPCAALLLFACFACGDGKSTEPGSVGGGGTQSTAGASGSGTTAGAGGSGTSAGAGGTEAGAGGGGSGGDATAQAWLPSWATTIQSTEPNNLPPALNDNTLRQFVWPTLSGSQIRIQLSNEKGSTPVDIQKVHIAKALTQADPGNSAGAIDPATDVAFTFSGAPNVSIPAGQTVWSDPLAFELKEIELTAISMQFGASVPPEITGHPGARTTSYIATGDVVAQQSVTGETRDRWYFINAIETMAREDAFAIAVLGDSITDGYGVLNTFGRWTDALTRAIQNDPMLAETRSVLNFGMGANNLTVSGQYQDSGVVRFSRDVVPRDKIKWLIVLEGTNDIIYSGVQAPAIIAAYQQIIQAAHAEGILVYGSPITPTNQGDAAIRASVNEWVRTSGEFDRVIDFAATIGDPNDPNAILPMYNNDGLHPNLAGYEAMGNAVDRSLFYQTLGN
ncbi:MAG TPA: GDSL-type esterase/lipase family protein [Polyangiaceae bacterium]|nr:GDSL-type esterase/lipase family protein [Polyangiaceae bacterium]